MSNNKDYLSQEEIDALLKLNSEDIQDDDSEESLEESSFDSDVPLDITHYLTAMEQDALGEIGNITFGSAATALSTLLGKKVDITTPKVSIIARSELVNEFPKPHVSVHVKYVDGFQGINLLVIRTTDAQVIADLMLGGDGTVPPEQLSEIHISAVQEAMNQMMGSSATSMSTIFNRFVNISPPGIDMLNLAEGEGVDNFPREDVFIKVSFRLIIGDLIDSTIMQLLAVPFAKEMVSILLGGSETQETHVQVNHQPVIAEEEIIGMPYVEPLQTNPAQQPAYQQPPFQQEPASEPLYQQQPLQQPMQQSMQQPMQQSMQQPMQQSMQQPMYQQQQQPMYQQPQQPVPGHGAFPNRNVQVQPVQYANFSAGAFPHADDTNLNLLLDIPLKVTVELGRTQRLIRDILELSQGSIIELDKLAGEPVDILVNNKLIAKGEVVVIDENFGVRVTDIVSQWDRIQKLQ